MARFSISDKRQQTGRFEAVTIGLTQDFDDGDRDKAFLDVKERVEDWLASTIREREAATN